MLASPLFIWLALSFAGTVIINTFLTLNSTGEGGVHHHPLLENRDFSGTEHLIRPVCKLIFVPCASIDIQTRLESKVEMLCSNP